MQAERVANLKTLDDQLVLNVINYARLKQSVAAVEAYFVALGELAGGSPADATEKAVSTLADRVNGLSDALNASGTPRLSDAQKTAIASLSKVVAKEIMARRWPGRWSVTCPSLVGHWSCSR